MYANTYNSIRKTVPVTLIQKMKLGPLCMSYLFHFQMTFTSGLKSKENA